MSEEILDTLKDAISKFRTASFFEEPYCIVCNRITFNAIKKALLALPVEKLGCKEDDFKLVSFEGLKFRIWNLVAKDKVYIFSKEAVDWLDRAPGIVL